MNNLTQDRLLRLAEQTFRNNFKPGVSFERAIFFSWGCVIGDCAFCYMSKQPEGKELRETRRSQESILAEFILAKAVGWDIGFFTGGMGILQPSELEFLLKSATEIIGEKLWLSVGPVSKPLLKRYLPYIKGVVGSTETINPELHQKVCPSKPLEPYELMFKTAKELNLKTAMTFIVGMGEAREDLKLLISFIQKYDIDKIHVYGLIPQQGTIFEKAEIPAKEEQAWWIAQLRVVFPGLDIQCGVWEDRVERVSLLLKAGANSISKFRATKLFGTTVAAEVERQAALAGRTFTGSLTILPKANWDETVSVLSLDDKMKLRVRSKLEVYLRQIKKNIGNRVRA